MNLEVGLGKTLGSNESLVKIIDPTEYAQA